MNAHSLFKALRYSSTDVCRLLLAIAAFLWGVAMLMAASTWDGSALRYPPPTPLFISIPRWGWGLIYLTDAGLIAWRLLATRSSVGVSRLILSGTSVLWAGNVIDSVFGLGHFGPGQAAEATLMLCSFWVTLRVGLNDSDKESS